MLIPATMLPHNNAVVYFLKLLCMDLVKQSRQNGQIVPSYKELFPLKMSDFLIYLFICLFFVLFRMGREHREITVVFLRYIVFQY